MIKDSLIKSIGDGYTISFWFDVWIGKTPLIHKATWEVPKHIKY